MKDAELLEKLKTDPNGGLRILVTQYEALLFSVVRGVLRSAPDADIEECVSDVFSDFYFALDRFDPEGGSVKAYLCVTAKNKAVNIARQTSRRREIDLPEETDVEDLAANERSAEEEYIGKERRTELARQVKNLGRPDSEIIFRKFYLCQTTAAIAKALGMSEGNVNVRTHRALKKLRKCLET